MEYRIQSYKGPYRNNSAAAAEDEFRKLFPSGMMPVTPENLNRVSDPRALLWLVDADVYAYEAASTAAYEKFAQISAETATANFRLQLSGHAVDLVEFDRAADKAREELWAALSTAFEVALRSRS